MKAMKRSWGTILAAIGFVILLGVLGVFQYRWMSQINESETEKARARVREQAERFAMDFNREIQNAYFNFQTDASSWKAEDWTEFNERYDFWREKTAYPQLISNFYFFETGTDAPPLKYDLASRSFVTGEPSAALDDMRARLSDEKNFKHLHEDLDTLVLPIHEGDRKIERILVRREASDKTLPLPMPMPEKYGYLAIGLDRAVITGPLLNDLNAKHFGDGEYHASVIDNADNTLYGTKLARDGADATAPLLNLSPENFVFFANKELMSSIGGERRKALVVNSHVDAREHSEVRGESNTMVKIELKQDAKPRTAVFSTTTDGEKKAGPWTLLVQHSAGSLDAFMAATLRRNLVIGFGILFLLAGAILAIVLSTQRARTLAQRQVDFVSSVSHEFRTPLAVIYSASENLADGVAKDDAQVSRYGELIKGEGRKLSAMVEQILDFAGANSHRRKYSFASASVNQIVESAIADCRPLLDGKGMTVETDLSADLPPINADAAALSQAIQNLIVNSVKYSDGERWLRIAAKNGGGSVRIVIEDRGIGISKSDLKQIFEPFFRSREVVDAQIHGNGLGLSLVKQIVDAHGGRVAAESDIGNGSKFTIEIPNQ